MPKPTKAGGGRTSVGAGTTALSREERIHEISRMLGGTEITAKTREHAEEMITRARLPVNAVVQTPGGELSLVWQGPTAIG